MGKLLDIEGEKVNEKDSAQSVLELAQMAIASACSLKAQGVLSSLSTWS